MKFLIPILVILIISQMVLVNGFRKHSKQFHQDCVLIDCIGYNDDILSIKRYIRDGANINGHDENGNTPLIEAVRIKRVDLIEYFLDCSANINMKNKDGESAIDIAKKLGYTDIEEYLSNRTKATA